MGISDKKKISNKKYHDKNTTVYTFRCVHSTDADIVEKLNSLSNKAGYIKQLIRDDLKNNK